VSEMGIHIAAASHGGRGLSRLESRAEKLAPRVSHVCFAPPGANPEPNVTR
jgi:hypothetical protein